MKEAIVGDYSRYVAHHLDDLVERRNLRKESPLVRAAAKGEQLTLFEQMVLVGEVELFTYPRELREHVTIGQEVYPLERHDAYDATHELWEGQGSKVDIADPRKSFVTPHEIVFRGAVDAIQLREQPGKLAVTQSQLIQFIILKRLDPDNRYQFQQHIAFIDPESL